MINIVVSITVALENRPQILPLLAALATASQQEKGNSMYQYYLHPTDDTQMVLVELWENADVLAKHELTDHFNTLLPQISNLATGLDIQRFNAEPIR